MSVVCTLGCECVYCVRGKKFNVKVEKLKKKKNVNVWKIKCESVWVFVGIKLVLLEDSNKNNNDNTMLGVEWNEYRSY